MNKILSEKIRGNNFDIRVLRTFSTSREVDLYAIDTGLQFIDEGSARKTYVLSSSKVLKVSKGPSGCFQQAHEVEVFQTVKSNFVPKIFDYDQKNNKINWIIAELVRPMTEKQFGYWTGTIQKGYTHTFAGVLSRLKKNQDPEKIREYYDNLHLIQDWQTVMQRASEILPFAEEAELDVEDLSWDNCGWGADGRPVVLDTGYAS